jgi:hypothetical protein
VNRKIQLVARIMAALLAVDDSFATLGIGDGISTNLRLAEKGISSTHLEIVAITPTWLNQLAGPYPFSAK